MSLNNLLTDTARALRTGAARIAACLPGSSIQFGPPRRSATSAAITDPLTLVRCSFVAARTSVRPAAELADPPLDQWMAQPGHATVKEIFAAAIPRGRYWGRFHGYIIDRNDALLTDLSPTLTPPGQRHDALDQLKLPPLQELRGTAAMINTLFANNYHHWLLDTVPRFEWVRRLGDWDDLNKIDHFILPKKLWPHNLQTLDRLGIDPAKVICSHPDLHVRADCLLVPAATEPANQPLEYDYTPEGLRFVRDLFLNGNPFLEKKHPARILISRERAQARRLVQADRIYDLLAGQGFEKILLEDHSLQEQAALFHHAECIVMPTGGNLANLVFCRPGTIVIELFSPSYCPPFTYAFMGELGLRYYGLVAENISRPHPDSREGNEDIDIDPNRLATVVRQALKQF